jgi:hypothetical protein
LIRVIFYTFFILILWHWVDEELSFITFLFPFYEIITILWLESQVRLIDLGVFYSFFLLIFFQFYPSILDWSRIKLYNLFWFVFYEVIPVSWLGWFLVSFLIDLFLISSFGWLGIQLHNLFWFDFYRVILISWFRFDRLTRVDSTHFLYWILFSTSSLTLS